MLFRSHIVEEQLREIQDDLPPGYYRKLPKLASGHLQGYPRVYGVAWAYVAHTDSHFDPEVLRRFVKAYQRVQPLDIGELWAAAITLRMGGKVVKNCAGFDLPKFFVGSLGRYGALAEITFKVFPSPASRLTLKLTTTDAEAAAQRRPSACRKR